MAGPQVSTWTCRGLLASLKWSCSFHFLCNQPLYSLFAGMEQRKREKRNMVPGFGLLTHQYFLNSVTLQPASWSCRVWVSPLPLFTDHFLSLCLFLFYLSANFCLVQGNCVQIIMGFMLFFFFFLPLLSKMQSEPWHKEFRCIPVPCPTESSSAGARTPRVLTLSEALSGNTQWTPFFQSFLNHGLPFPNPSKWLLVCFKVNEIDPRGMKSSSRI